MKNGLQLYNFGWPGSPRNIGAKLVEIAKTAENAGFCSLWIVNHFFRAGGVWGSVEGAALEENGETCYLKNIIKLGRIENEAF